RDTVKSRFEIFRAASAPKELVVSGSRDNSFDQSSEAEPENEEEMVEEIF
ncbi:MAG: hypothetical protein ACI9V8_001659, partial [Urechidicola sp.]